jgi:hypothetical protein
MRKHEEHLRVLRMAQQSIYEIYYARQYTFRVPSADEQGYTHSELWWRILMGDIHRDMAKAVRRMEIFGIRLPECVVNLLNDPPKWVAEESWKWEAAAESIIRQGEEVDCVDRVPWYARRANRPAWLSGYGKWLRERMNPTIK